MFRIKSIEEVSFIGVVRCYSKISKYAYYVFCAKQWLKKFKRSDDFYFFVGS